MNTQEGELYLTQIFGNYFDLVCLPFLVGTQLVIVGGMANKGIAEQRAYPPKRIIDAGDDVRIPLKPLLAILR